AVLDLVNSHLGQLHSFLGLFLRYINITLHGEGVAGHKWSGHFRAVDFHVFLPPLRFATHLVDAAHLGWHVFHLAGLHANDVLGIEIVERLHPFAFAAIVHQFLSDFFCIHSFSFIFDCELFNRYFAVDRRLPSQVAQMSTLASQPFASSPRDESVRLADRRPTLP